MLGLDPGLRRTGWGIILKENNHIRHIANGTIQSNSEDPLAKRLHSLYKGLCDVIRTYKPHQAAVEETFVNKNPASTLKLGAARGVVMLAPAQAGLPVAEYTPNKVKKSVVGVGHANKDQVQMMVKVLLPQCQVESADSADALAVAICHAHYYDQIKIKETIL